MRHKLPPSASRQPLLVARAHEFRLHPSEPERKLWAELRSCKLGVRFRRQVVVGSAICDFVAPVYRLVVEVDGASHKLRSGHDARRDRQLGRRGYRVLRMEAELVLRDLPAAVELVRGALRLSEPKPG